MSLWDITSIVFNGRRTGKTTWVMQQIHDLAIQNRTHEVLVVVSDSRMREFWVRTWRFEYPALTVPKIVTISNPLEARGRRFEKIFIEDIEDNEEGIYDHKLLMDVLPCLINARDPEVVFTCSPSPFSYEPLHKQESRLAREADTERRQREAARINRRKFLEDLVIKYMGVTGEMPTLPRTAWDDINGRSGEQ